MMRLACLKGFAAVFFCLGNMKSKTKVRTSLCGSPWHWPSAPGRRCCLWMLCPRPRSAGGLQNAALLSKTLSAISTVRNGDFFLNVKEPLGRHAAQIGRERNGVGFHNISFCSTYLKAHDRERKTLNISSWFFKIAFVFEEFLLEGDKSVKKPKSPGPI